MAKKKGNQNSNIPDSDNSHADRLFEWISAGLAVDHLVDAIKSRDQSKIDELFRDYSVKAARLAQVKQKLSELGFSENHERYHEYSDQMNDPMHIEELESLAKTLEINPKIKELRGELASLNTSGFEPEANRVKAMFNDGTDPAHIENEIKKLRKLIKEKFFEAAFEEAAVPLPQEKAPAQPISNGAASHTPSSMKFNAEIIFLLHKDGTLLSVKSRKPTPDLDKQLMSRMVKAIREQMARAFKEGEHIHSLNYEGHTIILEDSIHVYAAIVVVGEAKPVMYKVILKALQIMEKKLAPEFDSWKGDRNSLENLDKYTSAIFQTLDKL